MMLFQFGLAVFINHQSVALLRACCYDTTYDNSRVRTLYVLRVTSSPIDRCITLLLMMHDRCAMMHALYNAANNYVYTLLYVYMCAHVVQMCTCMHMHA